MQVGVVGVVLLLASGGVAAAFRYGGSPLTVRGGVGLVTVTHADPGDRIVVRRGGHRVASGDADQQGTLVVRDLVPGHYRVDQRRAGQVMVTRSADVMATDQEPPTSLYASQHLHPGLNDITTRDGTRLSAFVKLPGPAAKGPYPTVVEYSAYQIGDPYLVDGHEQSQPASAAARAMGYATVGVNVRGTGCSAGAFDLFSPAQAADGYDVVETVARQSWVSGHKVGLDGFSYGGLAALEVASTRPPSLNGVVALSVYGDAWQAFHPGGLDNGGFPVGWMRDLAHDSEPSGAAWIQDRIAAGDKDCLANQALHAQQVDVAKRYLGRVPDDQRFVDLSPEHWAPSIDVPVLLSSQFQDSTLGADLAEHLDTFSSAPVVKLVLGNGTHGDGIAPQLLRRMNDFLGLYVADRIPKPLDTADLIHQTQPGVNPARLPSGPNPPVRLGTASDLDGARAAYAAGPPIEVLWESGGGQPRGAASARWSTSYDAWPPPASKARSWYLAADGELDPRSADEPSAVRFHTDVPAATVPYDTEGNDLVDNSFQGWSTPNPSSNVAWQSSPFAADTAFAGTGSVDLWVRSDQVAADLQVVLLDVDRTGHETLVQNGWLRTSYRTLLPDSTARRPDTDFSRSAATPLVPGNWTLVRIRLSSFAHVLRAGSSLRLLVGTPGGGQVQWSFGPPPQGAA
ncbi:MAG TPA: CocE/NonD family hydrolase, partial [Acidimicrobiales bacterium]